MVTFQKEKLKDGINLLADAVKSTLGPKGRTVIMSRQFLGPHITKDGISVANQIKSEDPVEQLGIELIRETSQKTLEESGDGTTSSVVLAQAMINQDIVVTNPILLKKGIEEATQEVVTYIQKVAKKDVNIEAVATISANNDSSIGKLIAEAFSKAGNDALITVEESKSTETYIEITEGLKFDKGYISPYFVTDMDKMIAEYKDALILLSDEKIADSKKLYPILEYSVKVQRPLVIICQDLVDEALSTLVVNKMRGVKVVAVKAPQFGQTLKDMLDDFAVLTNGTALINEKGLTLEKFQPSFLGTSSVRITKDSTTLTESKGSKEAIATRIDQLKAQAESIENGFEQEKVLKRVAKLSNGAALIYVGAHTEAELKEKKDRVEDAVLATKAALAEGVVAGGGFTYIKAISHVKTSKNPDIQKGKDIVKKALEAPLRQILINSAQNVDEVITKVKSSTKGYNALSDKYENLLKSNIIDPAKVSRTALQNAASVATLYFTTECIITNIYNEPKL